ncbi:MAG: hypothetical protein ACRCSF_00890, partial [Mycobacteriaceae bacterium]
MCSDMRKIRLLLLVGITATTVMVGSGCSRNDSQWQSAEVISGVAFTDVGSDIRFHDWIIGVTDTRWSGDYLVAKVDVSQIDSQDKTLQWDDFRFGVYSTGNEIKEVSAADSCQGITEVTSLLATTSGGAKGSVCIGPIANHDSVEGIFAYIPNAFFGNPPMYLQLQPSVTAQSDSGPKIEIKNVEVQKNDGTTIELSAAQGVYDVGTSSVDITVTYPSGDPIENARRQGGLQMIDTGNQKEKSHHCSSSAVLLGSHNDSSSGIQSVRLCDSGPLTTLASSIFRVAPIDAAVWKI